MTDTAAAETGGLLSVPEEVRNNPLFRRGYDLGASDRLAGGVNHGAG